MHRAKARTVKCCNSPNKNHVQKSRCQIWHCPGDALHGYQVASPTLSDGQVWMAWGTWRVGTQGGRSHPEVGRWIIAILEALSICWPWSSCRPRCRDLCLILCTSPLCSFMVSQYFWLMKYSTWTAGPMPFPEEFGLDKGIGMIPVINKLQEEAILREILRLVQHPRVISNRKWRPICQLHMARMWPFFICGNMLGTLMEKLILVLHFKIRCLFQIAQSVKQMSKRIKLRKKISCPP